MMKRLKKIQKKIKPFLLMSWYTLFLYHGKVKESWLLVDSEDPVTIGSSLFQIIKEAAGNPEYGRIRIYVSCSKKNKKRIKALLQSYQMNKVTLVKRSSFRYARMLARAGFLFTDGAFPNWYVKKEGQVLTNTWQGTPLFATGRDDINTAYDMGSVQRNLLMSDYLVYSSDYAKNIMGSAYFLDPLYRGKMLCSGSPGNVVFFDEARRKELRSKFHLDEKRVYAYLPAGRGKGFDPLQVKDQMDYLFTYLDRKFKSDEVLFVKQDSFDKSKINFKAYKHIRPFPGGCQVYDFLNVCDCLVTDYSEVMFDFADSRKKIILYINDYEPYMEGKETYISFEDLPFPKVRRLQDLYEELEKPKDYDDADFLARYCQYDGRDADIKLCRHILKGEKVLDERKVQDKEKENVLIYGGGLGRNGITTALISLLGNLDLTKRNYYVAFRSGYLKNEHQRVRMLPEGVGYLPIPNMVWETLGEKLACTAHYRKNKSGFGIRKKMDRFYKRLYQRYFGHCHFDWVIHFFGYERDTINMFLQADAKRMIFVHNDMLSEIKTKGNQHEPTIRRAYAEYERVVPVTEDIYGFTRQLGKSDDNIFVVNNCHDYKNVLKKAQMPLHFDDYTESTVGQKELEEVLNGDARKIITIGRFSKEKGHDLLLKAFERYHKENPDSYLIIIGGYGPIYDQTKALAASLSAADHIIIIKAIANPMPILKRCDVFVLSSRYEALGLVLLEADTLGIPVISTDIPGPRGFMKEHGGFMVPLKEKGIYEGLKAFDAGKVKPMHVDYETYNQKAAAEFESLF